MNPDFTIGYNNIALAYLSLGRTEEVKDTMQRAARRKLPTKDPFATLFFAAFLDGDRNAMDRAAAQLASDIPSGGFEYYGSLVFACEGRLQMSRQASRQAVTLARQAHLAQRAALFEGAAAVTEALYGYPAESARHSSAAGQLVSGRDVDFGPAFAFALSGNFSAALAIVVRLEEQYPEDTCVHFSYSPALRALLDMIDGSPEKAVELLTVSKAYELAQTGVSCYARFGAMYPTYVRGLAYQQLHKPREAAAEFQRMLDHPGLLLADPIGPAARFQLARALRDSGEMAGAKAVYGEFLTLWKDADPDIPLLRQANTESSLL
jgi:tetratricopeptide (TPR) repeat protein